MTSATLWSELIQLIWCLELEKLEGYKCLPTYQSSGLIKCNEVVRIFGYQLNVQNLFIFVNVLEHNSCWFFFQVSIILSALSSFLHSLIHYFCPFLLHNLPFYPYRINQKESQGQLRTSLYLFYISRLDDKKFHILLTGNSFDLSKYKETNWVHIAASLACRCPDCSSHVRGKLASWCVQHWESFTDTKSHFLSSPMVKINYNPTHRPYTSYKILQYNFAFLFF